MVTIVALETSGSSCSIALIEGERLIVEYVLEEPNIHDRMLARLFQRVLADTNISIEQLNALALSAGPGSFTGLRIGFAFAKGLLFGSTMQFIAVPTLEACAFAAVPIAQHIRDCDIVAIAPAHDELAFVQHFACDGMPLSKPVLLDHQTIEQRISSCTIVCGPGARVFQGGIHIPGLERVTARFIAYRALTLLETGIISDPTIATPLYVEEFIPRTKRRPM